MRFVIREVLREPVAWPLALERQGEPAAVINGREEQPDAAAAWRHRN
jgi:hypothetical protein